MNYRDCACLAADGYPTRMDAAAQWFDVRGLVSVWRLGQILVKASHLYLNKTTATIRQAARNLHRVRQAPCFTARLGACGPGEFSSGALHRADWLEPN